MGLIRAVFDAVGGVVSDQWLEVFEADEMTGKTIFVKGVYVRPDEKKRSRNNKGTEDIVTNGSKIHVNENQMMILVDGGKIIQAVSEPGYYTVDNASAPSIFAANLGGVGLDIVKRITTGGTVPEKQSIYYINMKEISGIKYGTPNPIAYYDESYDAELFLRAHGDYSIKIVDPVKFYREVLVGNTESVSFDDINEQYNSEFLLAFQDALGKLSAEGESIKKVSSNTGLLAKTLQDCLDEDWTVMRGMQVQKVGLSVSYDDDSKALINLRNKAGMFKDAAVLNAHVQSNIAEGMNAAGSNPNGAMNAFMGMGMGMNSAGNFMGGSAQASQMAAQQSQMAAQQSQQNQPAPQPSAPQAFVAQQPTASADSWTCECGTSNSGKFCAECGKLRPAPVIAGEWTCECGTKNSGKFCAECGKSNPTPKSYRCNKCGYEPDKSKPVPKFCPECGDVINNDDIIN